MERTKLDEGLLDISKKILELTDLTRIAFNEALHALKEFDKEKALRIIRQDEEINNLEETINEDAILLIAKQAPVATDLRKVISAVKIAGDIERIADYAVNICKTITKCSVRLDAHYDQIETLANHMLSMLDKIEEAARNNDIVLAKAVAEEDSELDKAYRQMIGELIEITSEKTKEESVAALQTILIVKQIERAGDHITNIAEQIIYLVKGKRYDLN